MNIQPCTFMNARQEGVFTFPHTSLQTYDSFESGSPQLSGSPYRDTDSISDQSKKIRKRRSTYKKIDDGTRAKLLEAVHQGETLKAAAKRYDINYSSAKSILHTFRKEGRIFKKSAQERNTRKRTKSSNDLEMSPIYLSKPAQEELSGYPGSSFPNYFPNCKFETSSKYASTDEESPKHKNNVTINTFGDFLKVDSQGRQKSDSSLGPNSQTSTLVLKLESQRFRSTPVTNTQGIQSGNWLLNVNVHSQNQNKEQAQINGNNPLPKPEQKTLEPFRINCTNASLFAPERQKNEVINYATTALPKDSHVYPHHNNVESINFLNEEHHYEPNGFFDPSPAYAFNPNDTEGRIFLSMNNMNSYTNYKNFMPGAHEIYYEERN